MAVARDLPGLKNILACGLPSFARQALASVANLCVIPVQDYLGLGSGARINTPSTLGKNWKWRLKPGQLDDRLAEQIRRMTKLYGR